MTKKQFFKGALLWGILLWLIGYVLGFIFFFILPTAVIGWVIMPIGVVITLWVLWKRINLATFGDYLILALVWVLLAVALDYIFIVKALQSPDYYKLDVYLYYVFTFTFPLIAYLIKKTRIR